MQVCRGETEKLFRFRAQGKELLGVRLLEHGQLTAIAQTKLFGTKRHLAVASQKSADPSLQVERFWTRQTGCSPNSIPS